MLDCLAGVEALDEARSVGPAGSGAASRARYGSLGALSGSRRHAVRKGNARAGCEKPPGPRLPAIRGAFFRWRDSIRSVRRRACTRPDRLPLPSPLRSRLRCFRIRRSYSRGQRPRDRPVDAELPTGDSPLASHRRASRPRLTVPSNAAPTCTRPIGASIENFSRTRQPRAQRHAWRSADRAVPSCCRGRRHAPLSAVLSSMEIFCQIFLDNPAVSDSISFTAPNVTGSSNRSTNSAAILLVTDRSSLQ